MTVTQSSTLAEVLRERLLAPQDSDPDFWTFSNDSRRTMGHALLNYPAMMVPQVQGALLDALVATDPRHHTVFDPFAGSGTVMTESMLRGLSFRGVDINPLALLLLRTKARPIAEVRLSASLSTILAAANADRRRGTLQFAGREKWFSDPVAIQLTRLHKAISALPGQDTRRFFWVCLAGTVRHVSNSRTSTFKLHAYDDETLKIRSAEAIEEFHRIAVRNIRQATTQRTFLADAGLLTRGGRYDGSIDCELSDVRSLDAEPVQPADVLMTSPPYGDNLTTVPYGQYSYLPLNWVDRRDLDGGEQLASLLANPYRTDGASLGGRWTAETAEHFADLCLRSESARQIAQQLQGLRGDGYRRFAAFVCDFDKALEHINSQLRPGAFQFWTLGDRSISGIRIPTTKIVNELALDRGARHVVKLKREIPNGRKRMAIRNDTVSTIRSESILVVQTSSTLS